MNLLSIAVKRSLWSSISFSVNRGPPKSGPTSGLILPWGAVLGASLVPQPLASSVVPNHTEKRLLKVRRSFRNSFRFISWKYTKPAFTSIWSQAFAETADLSMWKVPFVYHFYSSNCVIVFPSIVSVIENVDSLDKGEVNVPCTYSILVKVMQPKIGITHLYVIPGR